MLDPDVLDSYLEEECTSDKSLYEAYLMAVQQRWLCETLMNHSVARGETAKTPLTKARAKEARVEKVARAREAKASVVARVP